MPYPISMLKQYKSELIRGSIAAVPLMLGFVPFALVLGAEAVAKGLSVVEVPLLTGMNFGGGSEFAALSVWTSPPNILLIVMITLLVNSRHLLMGAALAPHLKHLPYKKSLPALFLMCDETWALSLADTKKLNHFSYPYYIGVAVCLYSTWIAFTFLGAVIGPFLGDVRSYGLDMAFPAVFLYLLRGMWPGFKKAQPWLVSLLVAVLTYLLIPGAWYVAAGAVAGLISSYFFEGDT